jgi:hypothetical protein
MNQHGKQKNRKGRILAQQKPVRLPILTLTIIKVLARIETVHVGNFLLFLPSSFHGSLRLGLCSFRTQA